MSVDAKYEVTATANGGRRDGKTALADGTVFLDLVIPKELEVPVAMAQIPRSFQARQLVEATHEICHYSNAIKVSVDVKTTTRSSFRNSVRPLWLRSRIQGGNAANALWINRHGEVFSLSERAHVSRYKMRPQGT